MALEPFPRHAAFDIGPFRCRLQSEMSRALFKGLDVEVLRLILPSHAVLPLHRFAGELTIQCIEGVMEVCVAGIRRPLRAGQLVFVDRDTDYALCAIENSSALLTVALRA